MKWKVDYYNQSVKDNQRALEITIKAKFEATIEKMLEFGPDLGLPHTRAMGQGLFEIREKGKSGIARGFFCTPAHKTIVILHIFIKKTQATPKKELELARKRMKEVKKHVI